MLGRARRWVATQLAFVVVLVVLAAAFGYLLVEPHRTARVVGLFAVALLLAGLLRAVLPTSRAGLLAVRGRPVDVAIYLVLGGVLLALDLRLHG